MKNEFGVVMVKIFKVVILNLFLVSTACATSQKINGLYVNTFGQASDQSLIFVHGGPGFNSKDFELTTAEPLSKLGYFVVVYDERGQGRSDTSKNEDYNYKTYADDIKTISNSLNLKSPVLIGHSHGGPISIQFEKYYPGFAKSIVLVSGPVNFWKSMQSLYDNCSARYLSVNLTQYNDDLTKNFDLLKNHSIGSSALVEPTANVFFHALGGCKLYSTKSPTESEKQLRQNIANNLDPVEENSMPGFLINESYVYLNQMDFVAKNKGRFFAIYGSEDGLFTSDTLNEIKDAISDGQKERFFLVPGASHSVYIDQQEQFFKTLNTILKK